MMVAFFSSVAVDVVWFTRLSVLLDGWSLWNGESTPYRIRKEGRVFLPQVSHGIAPEVRLEVRRERLRDARATIAATRAASLAKSMSGELSLWGRERGIVSCSSLGGVEVRLSGVHFPL